MDSIKFEEKMMWRLGKLELFTKMFITIIGLVNTYLQSFHYAWEDDSMFSGNTVLDWEARRLPGLPTREKSTN